VPYAQANDRLIIAYSPLGMGLLSGRYSSANPPKGSARLNNPLFLPENLDRAQPLIDAVRAVANAHDARPAQVALAWVISHDNVVAIPGASSIEQLESNVAAADLELTIDEIETLTRASDAFSPPSGVGEYAKVAKRRLQRS
jgi:aryl-alcohol dehydrogenase-like predicted oxidoreductase